MTGSKATMVAMNFIDVYRPLRDSCYIIIYAHQERDFRRNVIRNKKSNT